MVNLHFDFRDVFRAARMAFSFQRIWIQFCGLVVGYAGYVILSYLSLLAGGRSYPAMWDRFGLLPWAFGMDLPWYSWVIYGAGIIFLLCVFLLTNTAVARASYMNMKGETFFTWKEAFGFALKKAGSVLAAPLAILGIIAFFVVGALLMGLLGRIPYVGELGFSLLTLFFVGSALFLFFVTVIFLVSLILIPAIVATTNEDAFEAVFQTFSTSTNQPWRLVVYEALLGVITLAGFVILAYAVKRAFLIMGILFTPSMGVKYTEIMGNSLYMLQDWLYPSLVWFNYVFGNFTKYIYFGREFFPQDLSVVKDIASYIFAICLLISGGLVVSYAVATNTVGNTIIYLVLRKKNDGENLLERKEKEEEKKEEAEVKEEKKEEVKAEASTKGEDQASEK